MPSVSIEERRSGTINIRVQPAERALIDQAAQERGMSRSDFMLDASRRAAQETLLDRTLLRVDGATYERFLAALDGEPAPNDKLRKLLATRAPWE
jgi:uncharacterized protein (DUF1778 family)